MAVSREPRLLLVPYLLASGNMENSDYEADTSSQDHPASKQNPRSGVEVSTEEQQPRAKTAPARSLSPAGDLLPEGTTMNLASRKLIPVRLISIAIEVLIAVAVTVATMIFFSAKWAWLFVPIAGYAVWMTWLVVAQVSRLGWLETDDELLISRGRLWHTFTVVPYGRIQFVDVLAGPFERIYGLKHVKLNTASATTDASIHGLEAAEADALRERLTVKARERMSGL